MSFPCNEAYAQGWCPGGECCGIQPIQRTLVMRHLDDAQCRYTTHGDDDFGRMIYSTDDLHCLFMNRETFQCAIYADRPQICHDFGTVEYMPCPYVKPDGAFRDRADRRRTKRQIAKTVNGVLQQAKEAIHGR